MRMFGKIVLAVVLLVAVYYLSWEWNEYYMGIAHKRFDSWMVEGSWRGEASQYNNARLGVLLEWGLGHAALWLVAILLFASGANQIQGGQAK